MPEKTQEELDQEKKLQENQGSEDNPQDDLDDDENFINSLLDDEDPSDGDEDPPKDETEEEKKKREEEEQRRKNKDAEEARKRREAEKKAKEEAERKAKEEEEAKAKEAEEAKRKEEEKAAKEKAEKEKRSANEKTLGEQLTTFKQKYPDVDLAELDKDKRFKKYIDGKLLGKSDFTELYEDYVEFRAELSGSSKEIVEKNYRKSKSSSGSSQKGGGEDLSDVYSEQELRKISEKLPYMNRKEAAKVEEKINRSIAYHEKN